jgi:sulfonate transport system permease protein
VPPTRAARLRGFILPAILLAAWYAATSLGWVRAQVLPAPLAVLDVIAGPAYRGDLILDLGASLRRVVEGALLGSAAGVLLGGAMGLSPACERLFGPLFQATRQVAIFAWVPLLTSWPGSGEVAKVVFVSLAAGSPVVMNTYQGIRNVPTPYLELADVFRFSWIKRLRKVVLPSALPSIVVGLQLAVIYAWLGTIGAEFLMNLSTGIGSFMMEAREHFRTHIVLVGILVIGLVGFGMHGVLNAMFRRLMRWRMDN